MIGGWHKANVLKYTVDTNTWAKNGTYPGGEVADVACVQWTQVVH